MVQTICVFNVLTLQESTGGNNWCRPAWDRWGQVREGCLEEVMPDMLDGVY